MNFLSKIFHANLAYCVHVENLILGALQLIELVHLPHVHKMYLDSFSFGKVQSLLSPKSFLLPHRSDHAAIYPFPSPSPFSFLPYNPPKAYAAAVDDDYSEA